MTEKRASTGVANRKRTTGPRVAKAAAVVGKSAKPAAKKKSVAPKPAAPRKKPVKAAPPAPARPTVQQVVLAALEELKAVEVRALDVRKLTDITDTMVVASGTSDRHVKSIADRVVQRCKEAGYRPYGMEGERDGEWVLVDLHDVVLHVMLPRVREFYALEKLWEAAPRVV